MKSSFNSPAGEQPVGIGLRAVGVLLQAGLWRLVDMVFLLRWPRLWRAHLEAFRAAWLEPAYDEVSFARRVAARSVGVSRVALTYGETPAVIGRQILRRSGVTEGSRVVDLGAGRGRFLLGAATLCDDVTGVELLEQHFDVASRSLADTNVKMLKASLLSVDVENYTHIYTTWTCFPRALRKKIEAHLSATRPGTIVSTITWPVEDASFELIDSFRTNFSWGRADVYVHRRRPSLSSGNTP